MNITDFNWFSLGHHYDVHNVILCSLFVCTLCLKRRAARNVIGREILCRTVIGASC